MRIAVLSGKGGAGKTLVSVNLAALSPGSTYVDCDVEGPNGHLFFKPEDSVEEGVAVGVPVVDPDRCDGCRKCVEFCRFNALAHVGGKLRVFEEVCHSCGGCMMVCPRKAISEGEKAIGTIRKGTSGDVAVWSGFLNPGEPSGVPIIDALLGGLEGDGTVFVDSPPGSACVVMESIKDADYCVLVAEPTLFGTHNLAMVHELVETFGKPFGVVLNKDQGGRNPAEEYCAENGLTILGRIPFDAELARITSDAGIAVNEGGRFREMFSGLLENVMGAVQ
ncbi:MAG: 4Fe-4S binding protein [Thermoplasmatales archaeon]|nr:4Fe-4S binding protein [Thermoplasmatales archaeon]